MTTAPAGAASARVRLRVAVAHEARLVGRYRIVHAGAFVTVLWVGFVVALPAAALPTAVPLLLFTEAVSVGLFFVAGLLLFERDEGTGAALDVTPLRYGERLAARLLVLASMSVAMAWAVTAAATFSGLPGPPGLVALTAGVWLATLVVLLVGHLTASRVASVTDYLVAVQVPLTPLALPLLGYLGWVETPLWWLLPTHGSLVLLESAMGAPPPAPATAAAVAVQVVWVAALAAVALRDRHRGRR